MLSYAERSDFYELDYAETGDLEFLSRMLRNGVGSVLEVPCAVGRLTLVLASLVRRYVGVDLEPQMVARLKQRLEERNPTGNVALHVGDMRALELGERFDVVIVQREAFQLLERSDAARTLRSLARHLAPAGKLVLDLATFDDVTPGDSALLPEYFSPNAADGVVRYEWTKQLPRGGAVTRSRRQTLLGDRAIRFEFLYEFTRLDGPSTSEEAAIEVARYTHDEIVDLARTAGLVPEAVYSDYADTPYAPGAVRMIFLLRHTMPCTD